MNKLTNIAKLLKKISIILPILLSENSAWSAEPAQKQKVLPVPGEQFMVENHVAFRIRPAPDKIQTDSTIPWVWYALTYVNLPEERERWMIERFLEAVSPWQGWTSACPMATQGADGFLGLLQTHGGTAGLQSQTGTPVPESGRLDALQVMKKHGIPINDLQGRRTRWEGYDKWKKGNDVHFNGAVSSMLANRSWTGLPGSSN